MKETSDFSYLKQNMPRHEYSVQYPISLKEFVLKKGNYGFINILLPRLSHEMRMNKTKTP